MPWIETRKFESCLTTWKSGTQSFMWSLKLILNMQRMGFGQCHSNLSKEAHAKSEG